MDRWQFTIRDGTVWSGGVTMEAGPIWVAPVAGSAEATWVGGAQADDWLRK